MIGRNAGINITKLAHLQGAMKGAISQMITRLIKKDLVMKDASPLTENEVVITLTPKGTPKGERIFQCT